MCNRKNGEKGMNLTKIPTEKLAQLIKKIRVTRRKHENGEPGWWFWLHVQNRAHAEMGTRYQKYKDYRREQGEKNVNIDKPEQRRKDLFE